MAVVTKKPEITGLEEKVDQVESLTYQLESDIALGRLKPRERLIEDELMLRFDVKRNVVRQVLFELEKLGLVARAKNKGAFVKDFSPQEVDDLYVVRELLEGKAVELIPLPIKADMIEELKIIHREYMEAKDKGEWAVVFRKNITFHKKIYRACNNPALFEAIELYMMKSHAIRSYSFLIPQILEQMAKEHQDMIIALEKGDLRSLKQLSLQHLRPAKETYLQLNKL